MITLHGIWIFAKFCAALGMAVACAYIVLVGVGVVLMVPVVIVCSAYSVVMTAFVMFISMSQLIFSAVVKHFISVLGITRSHKREKLKSRTTRTSQKNSSSRPGEGESTQKQKFDPYQVLQVTRSADGREIRVAYLRQMSQYHPDKVAHLGPELRILAEEKAKSIQQAYAALAGH